MLSKEIKLTPMMEQWHRAKNEHKDAILLFRMGDFYELFGDDAVTAAPILELALTSRDKDKSGLKMAGFPHHSADNYIAQLVERGFKVAICEQLEDPKASKGIVKRGVTNVVTPATAIESEVSNGEPCFLVSLYADAEQISLCALDLATASFLVTTTQISHNIEDELNRFAPKEIVIMAKDSRAEQLAKNYSKHQRHGVRLEVRADAQVGMLSAYVAKISLNDTESAAAGLVLGYVAALKGRLPSHLDCPKRYSIDEHLLIDESSVRNLDLFPKSKGERSNLFTVLDDSKTVMGKRALYQAIKSPKTSLADINFRHDLVSEFMDDGALRHFVREQLMNCYDLEKLTALLASYRVSPKGLAMMRDSLSCGQKITERISAASKPMLMRLLNDLPDVSLVLKTLEDALAENPPLNVKDGDIFKEGFDPVLDELKNLLKNSREMLLELEARERSSTGISSLKIRYTRVFGYYIEITKSNLDKVPAHYQRKQTIAGGERFVTKELSDLEVRMNSAQTDALALEEQRFKEMVQKLADKSVELMVMARKLALIDLLTCFAEQAVLRSYVRPCMLKAQDGLTIIEDGRHPIVEDRTIKEGIYFVPNSVHLNKNDCSVMLITGPNMAGKSTIMRQVALIQIMAQIGSFVPARMAKLSICDAVFARVGAADDIATGRSTFMVEMTETAAILKNASDQSLILLDEIGRGTSTFDGISIAQALAEYIHNHLKTRTLFATHYHELTELTKTLPSLKNYHVEIAEKASEISFLYTLAEGPCMKSFGIQVAHLSGLPKSLLARAEEILVALEQKSQSVLDSTPIEQAMPDTFAQARPQLDLFLRKKAEALSEEERAILEKIVAADINRLSPLQALNRLASWQGALKGMVRQ